MVGIFTKETFFFDSIAETMNVPPDHTFGACLRPEDYGKYTVFFSKANRQNPAPPHPTAQIMQWSSPSPSLKASNFKGLKYYININENNL